MRVELISSKLLWKFSIESCFKIVLRVRMTAKKDIWEIAIASAKEHQKLEEQEDTAFIFVGNKKAGKTSIIYRFLGCTDDPKTTLALEYSFLRQPKSSKPGQVVCNVWELGGGNLFTNLLDFAISAQNIKAMTAVLVLDLSVPEELILTTEILLNAIRERIKIIFENLDTSLTLNLKEKSRKRTVNNHPDLQKLDPFPIPLLILGSKYDIFQNFDPEKKKLVCRYLRFVAHQNAAQLLFVSANSESLINKCRNLLNNIAFQTSLTLNSVFDYNKPLVVRFGADSFQQIGSDSLESMKRSYTEIFPQQVTELVIPDDPAKDLNFKERDIDLIRAEKDRELQEYYHRISLQHRKN